MHLKIITHQKLVFDEDVDEIYTKGTAGEFGILPNHIPIMSALDIGVTKIIQDGKARYFTTMGGVLQFKDNEAIILTPTAEDGNDIDVARAKEALARARAKLAERDAELDVKRTEAAVARALARLKATMTN
ncbi:MAG: F0F1 ATP synthase subunit epsilon [Candidatus Gastranaerophilaceae bacterium]|jgi:F-type H+-transporting ATPase subunit epsilon|nr:F0F1 ATP synthase subunit epsilon [Candidatus Gastranaerophilaceae bacterium]